MKNERIKELADQADIQIEFDDYGEVRLSMAYGSAIEKFAELIVRECSRVAKLEVGTNRVCVAIENHFGIEP
jgi:polyribonucleotide nucleotidyltransferase